MKIIKLSVGNFLLILEKMFRKPQEEMWQINCLNYSDNNRHALSKVLKKKS